MRHEAPRHAKLFRGLRLAQLGGGKPQTWQPWTSSGLSACRSPPSISLVVAAAAAAAVRQHHPTSGLLQLRRAAANDDKDNDDRDYVASERTHYASGPRIARPAQFDVSR